MTPGETAYRRWCELVNSGQQLFRMNLSTWQQQTPAAREIWEEIARTALSRHEIIQAISPF